MSIVILHAIALFAPVQETNWVGAMLSRPVKAYMVRTLSAGRESMPHIQTFMTMISTFVRRRWSYEDAGPNSKTDHTQRIAGPGRGGPRSHPDDRRPRIHIGAGRRLRQRSEITR